VTNNPDLTFGEAVDRLEAIVTQLEGNEELGLEEALALYEQGLALAGDCRRRLATAQLKLTQLPVPADGDDEAT
jgi:exodeoxyribonuclease VII small subunit